jgi:hypothetical protein
MATGFTSPPRIANNLASFRAKRRQVNMEFSRGHELSRVPL